MTEAQQAGRVSTQQMLHSLRKSVRECLERKRLLGQYAAIWKDGRMQMLIPELQEPEDNPSNESAP